MTQPQLEWLTVHRTKVRLYRHGEGQPLLFLHGEEGGGKWLPIHERLSKNYQVIVPEHPGFGASEALPSLKRMDDLVFYYLDFLETLNLQNITVIGVSLGGWLAMEMATLKHPSIDSLILMNSAGIYVKDVPQANYFMLSPAEAAEQLFYDKALGRKLLLQYPEEEADFPIINRATTARLAWNPRFYNPQLRHRLHRVNIPVLLLWGMEDPIFPVDYAQELQALLSESQLEKLSSCGHYPHLEQPDQTAERTYTFLEKTARKGVTP